MSNKNYGKEIWEWEEPIITDINMFVNLTELSNSKVDFFEDSDTFKNEDWQLEKQRKTTKTRERNKVNAKNCRDRKKN